MPQCVAPPEITRLDMPLRRTAERLGKGDPLTVVALGSSSTAGAGASSPAMSYPPRLEAELARLLPPHRISVLNRGIGGELASDMLLRFDQSVAAEHPDLVLWQLGTNAVLRGHRLLAASLVRDGIARIKGINADVILIDPQFVPKVIVKADIADMIALISTVAKDAALARRERPAIRGIRFPRWAAYERLELRLPCEGTGDRDYGGRFPAALNVDACLIGKNATGTKIRQSAIVAEASNW